MKRALSDINNALKISSSEMALATAQYSDNEKSVESLTSKNKILESTISEQSSKIEILQSAMQNAASAHEAVGQKIEDLKTKLEEARSKMAEMGSSSDITKEQLKDQALSIQGLEKELGQAEKSYETTGKSTTNYATQLNNTKAKLIDMDKELEENKKALDKAETGNKSVADAVNGLASAAGINIPPALQGMVDKLDGVNASAATLVGVIGGIVTALGKLSFSAADSADDIVTLSKVTGMSTDAIQELNYAAPFLDVNFDTISGSLTKMIRNMDTAKDKTSDQAKAFRKLGVSVVDSHGQLRDANDTFMRTIDALGRVKNDTERDALSMTIFGRSAQDLNPLIEAGSGQLKEYAKQAHDMGYVLDNDTLTRLNELKDANDKLTMQWATVKNQLGEVLLPALTRLLETINSIPTSTFTTIAAVGGAIAIFGLLASSILPIIASFKVMSAASAIAGTAVAAGAGTAAAGFATILPEIALVVLAIGGIAVAGYEIATHWDEITSDISGGIDRLQSGFSGFSDWIDNTFSTNFASRIGGFGEILDGFATDARNQWQGIKDVMAGVGAFLHGTVTADWSEAFGGISRIIQGFAETAATIALIPINAVIGIANGILDLFNGIAQLLDRIKITLPQALGGGTYGVSIPMAQKIPYISLPRYATGTDYHPGGRALVGEEGPEIVDLPAGSRVYPNGVVPSGEATYNFYGDIVIDPHNANDLMTLLKFAGKQGQMMVKAKE